MEFNKDDTTKPVADAKFGSFEPDPSDPFIHRYRPAESELETINAWIKQEIDTAVDDDTPLKEKKLRLLSAYRGITEGSNQILTMPLVKRAVNRHVAITKSKVFAEVPLVTVRPTSNNEVTVLVEDQQYGTIPMQKTSEEVALALQWWFDWKLRSRLNFEEVVEVAATEAKRGQTPTWVKVVHKKEKRTIKQPRFDKKGPLAVTYSSKDDIEVVAGDPDKLINVSTYSMLMPADEQDPQESRWLSEDIPMTSEALRRALTNGDYFLIDKSEWEDFIANGIETETPDHETRKQEMERRIPSDPKGRHDVKEVWFYWTVPLKSSTTMVGDDGAPQEKRGKTYQEYSMVGHFHRKHGKFMSIVRNPRDDEKRPYVPFHDRKEPFRLTGESTAEDVISYQKAMSQLLSLEIRGAVVATTPIFYAEPGSMAGDWITSNEVEPGDVIPRLRPDEIEAKPLGDRPVSLLGTMQFLNGEFEKNESIGNLQLGLNIPSRTPSSSIAQVLKEGETNAGDFVARFCASMGKVMELYVSTVQQYMRTGEVIPFDPETRATIMAGLQGDAQQGAPDAMPVRFPMGPITDHFTFQMTAVTGETQQADYEKYVSFKQIVDEDGKNLANIIGPLASGNLPQSVVAALLQQVTRSQKLMEKIGDMVAKDGKKYAIPPQLLNAIAQEGQQLAQMHAMQAQQPPPPPPPQIKLNVSAQADPAETLAILQKAGVGNAQGTGGGGQTSGPQPNPPGVGGPVPPPGIPQGGGGNQGPVGPPPVGPPG